MPDESTMNRRHVLGGLAAAGAAGLVAEGRAAEPPAAEVRHGIGSVRAGQSVIGAIVPPGSDASVRVREKRIRPPCATARRMPHAEVVSELVRDGSRKRHGEARP